MVSNLAIIAWLADMETATATATQKYPHPNRRTPRKGKRAGPAKKAPPKKPTRRALAPAAGNLMNPPPIPNPKGKGRGKGPSKQKENVSPTRKSARLSGDQVRPSARQLRTRSATEPAAALVNPILNARVLSSSSQFGTVLSSTEAPSSTANKSGTSTRRSGSPVKTLRAMTSLKRPFRTGEPLGPICRDICTIPKSVASRLDKDTEFIQDHMLDPRTNREGIEFEYETLVELHGQARECEREGAHEAQWNTKVHDPMLSYALRAFRPQFKCVNITSAKPIPAFAPLFKDDPSGAKIVDFSINITPERGSSLEAAIQSLLRDQPPPLLTINQTLNQSDKHPAVVFIETKRGFYEEEDAEFKLGMWMAAWQNRTAALRPAEKFICTPLPGILVFGHEWCLYWVVDQGTRVDIIDFPLSIGSTKTVAGCYRLVAVLRYLLREWAPKSFLPWFKEKVLGPEKKDDEEAEEE